MTDHAPDAGADCPCICPDCRDSAYGHCLGVYCAHQHPPIHQESVL